MYDCMVLYFDVMSDSEFGRTFDKSAYVEEVELDLVARACCGTLRFVLQPILAYVDLICCG